MRCRRYCWQAGWARGLRSVVNDRPKPMALIEGKPFMEYVVHELVPPWDYGDYFCRGVQGLHGGGVFSGREEVSAFTVSYAYEEDAFGDGREP